MLKFKAFIKIRVGNLLENRVPGSDDIKNRKTGRTGSVSLVSINLDFSTFDSLNIYLAINTNKV
jgi:hypothetical protein